MVIDPDCNNDGIIDINSGGSLNVNANGIVKMGPDNIINVNNGGWLNIVGYLGNEAMITQNSRSGYHSINVMDSGTILADHAVFEYMSIDGLHLHPGSIVYQTGQLGNCIFQNGITGGNLLTIDNTQDLTVNDAIFPTNTWGSTYNVFKT